MINFKTSWKTITILLFAFAGLVGSTVGLGMTLAVEDKPIISNSANVKILRGEIKKLTKEISTLQEKNWDWSKRLFRQKQIEAPKRWGTLSKQVKEINNLKKQIETLKKSTP